MSCSNALSEEIEVLESIYDKDLKYNKNEIIIKLFPLEGKEEKENHVHLDFCLVCSDAYPKKEPDMSLRNVRGLSDNQVEILYSKLKEEAKLLKGEVMIYNLAHLIQEYLLENNKPEKKSCYEEMISRQEQERQEEYESEVNKITKLILDIKEKQKVMQKYNENDSSNYDTDDEDNEDCFAVQKERMNVNHMVSPSASFYTTLDKGISCQHRNCKYIQFNNKILRGCCIGHNENNIVYCGIDSTTGDQLLLHEWILKPKSKDCQVDLEIQNKLECFQKELDKLKKLCHENLISYIDLKWSFDKREWIVHVLQEYVCNFTLNILVNKKLDFNVTFIREILDGILHGLQHLHSHGIVHGCITDSNIYFSKLGVVKLSNYSVHKSIDDLSSSIRCGQFQKSDVKVSQKTDILEVGLLLLKMLKIATTGRENIVVPDIQPPDLKDFIEKCITENEEGRWTSKKLLHHKFLIFKDNKQKVPAKKYSDGGASDEVNEDEIEKPFESFFDGNENSNSRLTKEFKILNQVGSGSFGKVFKVKNKLDGSVYAIKAIRLSTKNKQMDKKMIREVKLLSKLNHENIVRYYTSWIETDSNTSDGPSGDKNSDVVDSSLSYTVTHKIRDTEEVDDDDDEDYEDDEEEYEDEDDENVDVIDSKDEINSSRNYVRSTDLSSYVEFLKDSRGEKHFHDISSEVEYENKNLKVVVANKTMYIQMEFCEKSTLRNAMNDTSLKLYEDESRLWRLFREIVEGMAYVHEQGMIHRDLKPENIFLDLNDHVKIGDFGLATASAVSNCTNTYMLLNQVALDNASSQNLYDGYHTGKVGTSLYVAPELDKSYGKSFYNKKVDVYSLGIIFFEMCNGKFDTDMERIDTLLKLRKPEIIFPPSWDDKVLLQRSLVEKLLKHDPKSRPSCQEILEGHISHSQIEYEHLQQIIRQSLSNSKSKIYKYLISSCFDQEVRIEEDIAYQWENIRSEKQYFLLDLIKDKLEVIFKRHGAIYVPAPLLFPQSKDFRKIGSQVQLMTNSGNIVHLPYDLRISFARYVASKALIRLRRYVIERVYRQKKVHGLYPKEQYECAFDLVTPKSTGIENAEVEVFTIIKEIVNDFKSLRKKNCMIRFNHSWILKALLIHFNSEKWYSDVFKILSLSKENKYFRNKLQSNLQQLGIPSVGTLVQLFLKEDSLGNIKKELLSLLNKRGKALDILNVALQKLSFLIEQVEKFYLNIPIKVSLGVVCNSEHCSNVMFDVVYYVKQKGKKEGCVTLMSGCRYDRLITSFRKIIEFSSEGSEVDKQAAIGFTVYLDKVAAVLKEDNILSEYVVICSFSNTSMSNAKDSMAKILRKTGIKCYIEETIETLEEIKDYCRENKIIHIVNLKDEECSFAFVMTWDNDKSHFVEKKINVRDISEYLIKQLKLNEDQSSASFSRQSSEQQGRASLSDALNCTLNININFVIDEKLSSNQRKRYESQIRSRISSLTSMFSPRIRLEIIAVFLDEQKVKELAVNYKSHNDPNENLECMADRNSEKKYISKVYYKVKTLFTDNSKMVVILYSLNQDKYHFILDT